MFFRGHDCDSIGPERYTKEEWQSLRRTKEPLQRSLEKPAPVQLRLDLSEVDGYGSGLDADLLDRR